MPRISVIALAAVPALALSACGGGDNRPQRELAPAQVSTIGVNSYLWRAALDTLDFAPLVQADAASGVIITDWYANPAAPTERMKVTVSILDTNLRSDALAVAASRQLYNGSQWLEAPVQAATVQRLEEIILTRARELRRNAVIG